MGARKKGELTNEQIAATLPGYLPLGERPICKNCGKELQLAFMQQREDGGLYCYNGFPDRAVKVRYGFEGDGFFCTKSCGYNYGVRVCKARQS